ncbi:MAG: caspase family protein [Bacteroidia bacterium]|nr:caspase family protein [Bacteroidia bacterium]
MGRLLTLSLFLCVIHSAHSQGTFSRVFGGSADEHALALTPTRDGGYAIAGFTYSFGAGRSDVWVMKVNRYGQEEWRKILGGPDYDWANDLVETRDGNLVVAGYQRDSVTGHRNAWVFQLNRHGDLMWSQVYGGEQGDEAKALTQTTDGGFAVVGYSHSFSKGESDVWLLRLNAVGVEMWQKHYGTKEAEKGYSIKETRDEGFVIGGFQTADDSNKADMLIVRIDRNGNGVWRQVIRAPGNDVVESILETATGNILAAGWGYTHDQGLQGRVVELSPGGRQLRDTYLGGAGKEVIYDLEAVPQGGYIAVGQSGEEGRADVWLVRLDERGNPLWETRTKGPKEDYGHAVKPTADGGFLIAGGSESLAQGGSDICLFKTDRMGRFDASSMAFESQQSQPVVRTDSDFSNGVVKPDLYVLAVGVSGYNDEGFSLQFAHQDAASVARKFAEQEGALFRNVETRIITNEDATLVNIKAGLSWLEQQATQKDLIVMFISAHGALDHKGSHYLLPTDFDPHNLFATGLNIRDLTEGVSATPCKKLIFLDACHSGQSGFDFLEFASIKAFDLNQAVEELAEREPGVTVITSSSGREFSYERPEWGHGAFTKALLEGLNGSADVNADYLVTLAELNFYIIERVKDLTSGRQHPYMPINLFGNIPLFALPQD